MKNLYTFVTAILLIYAGTASSQLFKTTYGGSSDDELLSVVAVENGNLLLIGLTASVGSGDLDLLVIKTNSSGTVIWEKTYGGSGRDMGYSGVLAPNGNYIISGINGTGSSGLEDGLIFEIDVNGNVIWSKTFGGSSNEYGRDIIVSNDQNLYVTGYTQSFGFGSMDYFIIKTNTSGIPIWSQTYGTTAFETPYSITQDSDDNLLAPGFIQLSTSNFDGSILKTDAAGNIRWSYRYGGSGKDILFKTVEGNNGDYLSVGYSNSFSNGSRDIWILKTDTSGAVLWSKVLVATGDGYADDVQLLPSGEYMIHGYVNSDSDMVMIKIDDSGNLLWTKQYGGINKEDGYGKQGKKLIANGNELVFIGNSTSYNAGDRDFFLLKTDANGEDPERETCEQDTVYLLPANASVSKQNWNIASGFFTSVPTVTLSSTNPTISSQYLCGVPTAVDDEDFKTQTVVYPNPSSGKFNISFESPGTGHGEIIIVDQMGRTIHLQELNLKTGHNNFAIELSGYPTGVYFLRLKTEKTVMTKAIEISR